MRAPPSGRIPAFTVMAAFVAAFASFADGPQPRSRAKHVWEKREVVVEYDATADAHQTLWDTAVGANWTFGSPDAPLLRLEAPLGHDTAFAPPGAYRIDVHHPTANDYYFIVEGGGFGTCDQPRMGWRVKPSKGAGAGPLGFEWTRTDKDGPNEEVTLVATRGGDRIAPELVVVGGTRHDAGLWTVDAFSFSADALRTIHGVGNRAPIATFRPKAARPEGLEALNLLLGKDDAIVQATSLGTFGKKGVSAPTPPDPRWTRRGTVTRSRAAKASRTFAIEKVEAGPDKAFKVRGVCGSEALEIRVPDPTAE